LNEHTSKILTKKNIFVNSYLRALSKSLHLIQQRLEYKLGNDENLYDNAELLQALVQCYCLFFNYVPEYSPVMSQANINKHLLMVNMELIVSILSIWSELTGFTETMIYELCYRFYSSMRNRPAILYLMGTLLEMMGASDKAVFNEALKALITPYNPKKYERKPDTKEKEIPGHKERKPLILLKYRHHEEMFHDLLQKDKENIMLEFMFNSLFEFKSGIFETSLDKFLDSLFQMTDYKTLKDLMVIFEKKWKHFYEYRNDYLSDDHHRVIFSFLPNLRTRLSGECSTSSKNCPSPTSSRLI
jgi:hypothetical protein